MSADVNQTFDVRIPSTTVADAPGDIDEGDTVTPLPYVHVQKTFDMGIPVLHLHSPKRSHSVPAPSTPKYRVDRRGYRSAISFDSLQQQIPPPPPPATIITSSPADDYIIDKDPFLFEPARIQIKPEVHVRPASIAESQPSLTAARCVNERLDKYMVIRQRTFHGLARSRSELRTLPLTDPREVHVAHHQKDTPSWMYRSKTDLYIERRRAKLRSQSTRNTSSAGSVNLNGMTFGNLVDHLPAPKPDIPPLHHHQSKSLRYSPGVFSPNQDPMCSSNSSSSGEGDGRLPPLSLNKMKQMMQNDISTFNIQDSSNLMVDEDTSRTSIVVENPPAGSPRGLRGRGRLRKQPLVAAIPVPLRVWEPSFDYVVVNNAKNFTPRNESGAFGVRDTRQQPSPMK